MRIHSSALLLVVSAGAAASSSSATVAAGATAARPWGLGAFRAASSSSPHPSPSLGWSIVPRGGDDASAEAEVEAPPTPPPPPPPAVSSAKAEAEASSEAVATDAAASASADETAAAEEKKEKEEGDDEDFEDLDARVKKAMKKLGLSTDDDEEEEKEEDTAAAVASASASASEGTEECKDGVCELPPAPAVVAAAEKEEEEEGKAPPAAASASASVDGSDPLALADALSAEYSIPRQVVLASIGASGYIGGNEGETVDVDAIRIILEGERMLTGTVDEYSEEAKLLASEGHDPYLTRRALAFADMNVDDARAILIADEEDEEEERRERTEYEAKVEEERRRIKAEEDRKSKEKAESEMKTVNVAAGFDPTAPSPAAAGGAAAAAGLQGLMGSGAGGGAGKSAAAPKGGGGGAPKPAKKEDVVFEITEEDQIQSLVIESPVPVLLDVYADWCGPCKMLTPALEQMATKAGGMFRLVKLNTDEHRSISQSLEVQALPTVFGVRDGKVVNSFQGMPRDEEALRNFMMGLLGAGSFDPPLTDAEVKKHASLSIKLLKVAGASSFPFSARERLQGRTKSLLDDLAEERGMADAEESAATVRSLLSNVIRDPFEAKFRRVNLENKVIQARVAAFPSCVSVLKSAGFVEKGGGALVLAEGKKAVNLAPLVVARDCIDKWIDRNRYNIAKAARKKRDEAERVKLAEETARLHAEAGEGDEYDTEDESEEVDPDACAIKVRMEGKKRVHELMMRADDPLSKLVESLPGGAAGEGEEVRVTCAAKRLIVKSTDEGAMAKSLRDHGLTPAAAVVVKIGGGAPSAAGGAAEGGSSSGLAERAAARKNRRKGSEATMQSVGIYSKDDNAKGELIDGGGGVWYEQDVTDDEEEGEGEQAEEERESGDEDGGSDDDSESEEA